MGKRSPPGVHVLGPGRKLRCQCRIPIQTRWPRLPARRRHRARHQASDDLGKSAAVEEVAAGGIDVRPAGRDRRGQVEGVGKRHQSIAAGVPEGHRDPHLSRGKAPVPAADQVVVDHRAGIRLTAESRRAQTESREDRTYVRAAERDHRDLVAQARDCPDPVARNERADGGKRDDPLGERPAARERVGRPGRDSDHREPSVPERVHQFVEIRREVGDGAAGSGVRAAEPRPVDNQVANPEPLREQVEFGRAPTWRADRAVAVDDRESVMRPRRGESDRAPVSQAGRIGPRGNRGGHLLGFRKPP